MRVSCLSDAAAVAKRINSLRLEVILTEGKTEHFARAVTDTIRVADESEDPTAEEVNNLRVDVGDLGEDLRQFISAEVAGVKTSVSDRLDALEQLMRSNRAEAVCSGGVGSAGTSVGSTGTSVVACGSPPMECFNRVQHQGAADLVQAAMPNEKAATSTCTPTKVTKSSPNHFMAKLFAPRTPSSKAAKLPIAVAVAAAVVEKNKSLANELGV